MQIRKKMWIISLHEEIISNSNYSRPWHKQEYFRYWRLLKKIRINFNSLIFQNFISTHITSTICIINKPHFYDNYKIQKPITYQINTRRIAHSKTHKSEQTCFQRCAYPSRGHLHTELFKISDIHNNNNNNYDRSATIHRPRRIALRGCGNSRENLPTVTWLFRAFPAESLGFPIWTSVSDEFLVATDLNLEQFKQWRVPPAE